MQATRQQILKILREHREATVQQVVTALRMIRGDKITPVTVRHHLNILHEEGLVDTPQTQHQRKPGRPRHVYELTDKGHAYFPNNYQRLATELLEQIQAQLPDERVNVILEGVAANMSQDANIPDGTMPERLTAAIDYLNTCGYQASWETGENGYLLYMSNCPYHSLTADSGHLCQMDLRLLTTMLGVVPRLNTQIAHDDETCSYFIPETES